MMLVAQCADHLYGGHETTRSSRGALRKRVIRFAVRGSSWLAGQITWEDMARTNHILSSGGACAYASVLIRAYSTLFPVQHTNIASYLHYGRIYSTMTIYGGLVDRPTTEKQINHDLAPLFDVMLITSCVLLNERTKTTDPCLHGIIASRPVE